MKPFRTNLKLVIKKYLCIWHEYFPGVEYYSNDLMLSEISEYIFLTFTIKLVLNVYIVFKTKKLCEILMKLYI